MASSPVLYETRGRVALVTINRPEKLNAINGAVQEGLAAAWERFESGQARVAVLTASGDRAFSAGADIDDLPPDLPRCVPGVGVEVSKPIIAAPFGWCVGGGLVLVIMADLCIAADTTRFLYPEAKLGLTGGLITGIAGRIPHKVAMELPLVGEPLLAERALEVGFVNRVVPPDELVQAAMDDAEKIAANAPLVVSILRREMNALMPESAPAVAARTRLAYARIRESDDLTEGVAAFREKRKPDFKGK